MEAFFGKWFGNCLQKFTKGKTTNVLKPNRGWMQFNGGFFANYKLFLGFVECTKKTLVLK